MTKFASSLVAAIILLQMACYIMTTFPATTNITKEQFGHVTIGPPAIDYIELRVHSAHMLSTLRHHSIIYYPTVQIALTGASGL